jgi:hypothetical protein
LIGSLKEPFAKKDAGVAAGSPTVTVSLATVSVHSVKRAILAVTLKSTLNKKN